MGLDVGLGRTLAVAVTGSMAASQAILGAAARKERTHKETTEKARRYERAIANAMIRD